MVNETNLKPAYTVAELASTLQHQKTQSGDFPCLMAPAGPWELAFFVLASGLIFRA